MNVNTKVVYRSVDDADIKNGLHVIPDKFQDEARELLNGKKFVVLPNSTTSKLFKWSKKIRIKTNNQQK